VSGGPGRSRLSDFIRRRFVIIACLLVIAIGGVLRYRATVWGLPYAYSWDEPEITNPAIRVLRDGVYRPTRFAYGPIVPYMHAAWGTQSLIKAVADNDIHDLWSLKTDWDTGWYWTIASPVFHRQARVLSVLMWVVTALAIWGACASAKVRGGAVAAVALLAFSGANFGDSSVVSAGPPAAMFSALALWAGLRFLRADGTGRALGSAIAASSAAVACKLVFVPMLWVPVGACLGRAWVHRRRVAWGVVFAALALGLVGAAILMLPIFFDMPRFVWSILVEEKYYAKDASSFAFLVHLKSALLAGAASLDVCGLDAEKGQYVVQHLRPDYLIFLVLAVGGAVVAVERRGTALVLLVPAFFNMWHVSAFRGEFFPRNMFITQLCVAVLAGMGFDWMCEYSRRYSSRLRTWFIALVGLLIMVPVWRVAQIGYERATVVDSRVKMADNLRPLVKSGKKVVVASELHWFFPATEEGQKEKLPQASVTRLLRYPSEAQEFDYAVVPRELRVYSQDSDFKDELAAWNRAIRRMQVADELGTKGTFFDLFSTDPRIALVRTTQFRTAERLEARRICGFELISAKNESACAITRAGVAVKNYWVGAAAMRLTTSTQTVVVKGRGLDPFGGDEVPTVYVEVLPTTGTQQGAPPSKVSVLMTRSASGLVEYPAKMKLAPGDYVVTVRADYPNTRFMTEIEFVEFR
jgi:hypothetical protein